MSHVPRYCEIHCCIQFSTSITIHKHLDTYWIRISDTVQVYSSGTLREYTELPGLALFSSPNCYKCRDPNLAMEAHCPGGVAGSAWPCVGIGVLHRCCRPRLVHMGGILERCPVEPSPRLLQGLQQPTARYRYYLPQPVCLPSPLPTPTPSSSPVHGVSRGRARLLPSQAGFPVPGRPAVVYHLWPAILGFTV